MAEAMAEPAADAATEVLGFRLAAGQHALPAAAIAEIIRLRPLTRLPQGPPSLLGIVNLRGRILPVVSLAGLMGLAPAAPTSASRIIVLAEGPGLLVDAVTGLAPAAGQRPVEIAALLARDFGQARRQAATAPPAKPAAPAPQRDDTLALIGILLAGQHYALPLDRVLEVARLPEAITGLPAAESAMAGVMPFRGGLLPLVSLRALLGLAPAPASGQPEARIVVARIGPNRLRGHRVGLVVDALQVILRVPGEAVDPVPAVLTRGAGEARIEAIARLDGGRRLVSILSTERLFDAATATRLSAGTEEEGLPMTREDRAEVAQFVLFRLGEEHYGLPVGMVDEVVRHPPALTRVPRAPAFLLGVMALRGRVVPVIDQRRRFEVAGPAAARSRIIIITVDGLQAGFAVDSASELRGIAPHEIEPVPAMGPASGATSGETGTQVFDRIATLAEDGRMVLLIEPRALLDRAERDLLASIAADVPNA